MRRRKNPTISASNHDEAGAPDRVRRQGWLGVALTTPRRVPPVPAAGVVGLMLGAAWSASNVIGGAGVVPPHWFYFPIFFAGIRFGPWGALTTAITATVVAGPLLPLTVDPPTAQPASDWASRGAFFVAIGVSTTAALNRLQAVLSSERAVLDEARHLSESKAVIIQSVSHEFRTPLTIMKGTTEILSKVLEDDDILDLVSALQRSTRRLEDLVETILAAGDALDRRAQGPSPSIDVSSLCREISEEVDAAARTRVNGTALPVRVVVDLRLLRVALRGVLENAARFAPRAAPVDVTVVHRPDHVEVRIVDRGDPLDADVLERMFESVGESDPAHRSRSERLSLGLFAAKVIIERSGGDVAVGRGPRGGNQFVLRVPRLAETHSLPANN